MADYILAIDQGTTSTRSIIFDKKGSIVATGQLEHEQIFPRPGWVEHDPMEIWHNTREVIGRVQEDGTCWLAGTTWQGRAAMRVSIVNWATNEVDIDRSAAAILRSAEVG